MLNYIYNIKYSIENILKRVSDLLQVPVKQLLVVIPFYIH